ncbi:hypothetical protein OH77DRAFT_86545 [Trametes cingulata]|nr:hypothetical protein OH77DRAFT_86545 [Trametes cingulata]
MLLSHTVLAVVFGGLLASARPEWGSAQAYYQDVESTDTRYAQQTPDAIRRGGSWQWVPDGSQTVMGVHASNEDERERRPFPPPFPDIPGPPDDRPEPPHRVPLPPHPPFPRPPDEGPAHPPPGAPNHSRQTIYEFLQTNPKFSRIFKLVNYTEEITNLLNDTSVNVTFFAVPNWALPPPPPHHPHDGDASWFNSAAAEPWEALALAEGLVQVDDHHHDEGRKKFLKAILKAILKYETLPAAYSSSELAKNVTFATALALSDGSLDGEPLRVRVGAGPGVFTPHINVNVVSKVIRPDIKTKNGFVHVVNKPVLPPPSIFQIGFLFQEHFSTLVCVPPQSSFAMIVMPFLQTSALQRVGLTDAIEWREVPSSDGKHTVDGSPAVTFFAPTNKAFARLPRKLRGFLFSPFGEKALKKLLQFHIVPEVVLHADYVHNASEAESAFVRRNSIDEAVFESYEGFGYDDLQISPEALKQSPLERTSGWWSETTAKSPSDEDNWYEARNPRAAEGPDAEHAVPPLYGPHPYGPHHHPFPHHPPFRHSYSGHHGYDHFPHHEGPHHPYAPHHYPPWAEHHSHFFPSPFEHGPPFPPHHPWEHDPHHPPAHHPWEHGPHHPPPHHSPWGYDPHFHHPPPPPTHQSPFAHGLHEFPRSPPHSPHYHRGCRDESHFSPPFPPHAPAYGPYFSPPPHHPTFEYGPHPPPPYYHYPVGEGPHFPGHGPHFPPPPPPSPPPHAPHHHPFEDGPHHLPRPHGPKLFYSRNITTSTLLTNHSLNLLVVQLEHTIPIPGHHRTFYTTTTFAHGTPVSVSDIPTRNGVLHIVDRILNPKKTVVRS